MMSSDYTPGFHEYREGREIAAEGAGFYSLIEAAMRAADSDNIEILKAAYPNVYADLMARYNAPNGMLPEEHAEIGRKH